MFEFIPRNIDKRQEQIRLNDEKKFKERKSEILQFIEERLEFQFNFSPNWFNHTYEKIKSQRFDYDNIELEDSILRQSGRSTREIDLYIQEFFTKGSVTIIDHYEKYVDNNKTRPSKDLLKRFIRRIQTEHSNVRFEVNEKDVTLIKR